MLLPPTCPACGRPGSAPCAACVARMRRSPPVPVPAGLVACRAVLVYEGPAREVVARLKYRNARDVAGWLAQGLAGLVAPHDRPVLVTWAPTTAARRRARGFDQAEVLARLLARRHLRLPCRRLLRRLPGPAQTGRSLGARRLGPAFAVHGRSPPLGPVVVVDDVVTTGATLAAAAGALGEAGIGPVIGLAAAHTVASSWWSA